MIFATANMDFAQDGDVAYLEHLSERASVLALQECKDVNVHAAGLQLHFRQVAQDRKSPARAGTAIVGVDRELRHVAWWLLGRSAVTLPRTVTRARVNGIVVLSAHIAPPRAGFAVQDRQAKRLMLAARRLDRRGIPWVIAADWNRPPAGVRAWAKRYKVKAPQYVSRGVCGLLVSHRLHIIDSGADRYAIRHGMSDHAAVWAEVRQ